MTTSVAGRFGAGAGMGTDVVRVFSRALELFNSSAGDSDCELLEMVKRAKRETDKEPFHLTKKARSSRFAAAPAVEAAEWQSLGHSNRSSSAAQAQAAAMVVAGAAAAPEHTSSSPVGGSSWSEGGSGAPSAAAAAAVATSEASSAAGGVSSSAAAGGGSMTHTQARLRNVIRGVPGRGRIEKPKRKVAR